MAELAKQCWDEIEISDESDWTDSFAKKDIASSSREQDTNLVVIDSDTESDDEYKEPVSEAEKGLAVEPVFSVFLPCTTPPRVGYIHHPQLVAAADRLPSNLERVLAF